MPNIRFPSSEYEPDCYNADTDTYENCERCVEDSDCCSGYCYDIKGDGVQICYTWYVEVVKTNSTKSIMIISNAYNKTSTCTLKTFQP